MNIKQLLIAAVAFSAIAPAFAQNAEFTAPDANFVSSKTRAEVVSEFKVAQAAGTVFHNDVYPEPRIAVASTRTRDDVRREATQSAQKNERNNATNIYFGG